VVDKVALGQDFPEYFGFTCQFSCHPLLHIHHSSYHDNPLLEQIPRTNRIHRRNWKKRVDWISSHVSPKKKTTLNVNQKEKEVWKDL
jgi:hypothetical protein